MHKRLNARSVFDGPVFEMAESRGARISIGLMENIEIVVV
jgi:hypothetical protein